MARIIELEVNRKKIELAAGLVWHPLQETGSKRAEILEFARMASCDLKVLRGQESPHVGLASRRDGVKPGQIAAAAVIADALAEEGHRSALVALPLPDDLSKALFVAIRDSVILADGDVVASVAQTQQRLIEDKAYGGWDIVVCPEDWGVPGVEQRGLEDFFGPAVLRKSKQWRLQEVHVDVRKTALLLAACAAIALGSTYGWKAYKARQAAAEALRIQQQLEAEQRAKAAEAKAAPPKPWPNMPNPVVFAQACSKAYEEVGTVAGNWRIDGGACENGALTVRWIKADNSAWISHLHAVRPNAVVAPDGKSATVTVPISAALAQDSSETLLPPAALRLRYFEIESRFGLTVKVDPPTLAGTPAAPASGGVAPAAPQWGEMPVTVTARFDPVEVARLLDAPGLRLTKIVFAYGQDGVPQYQFTGVHYVHP